MKKILLIGGITLAVVFGGISYLFFSTIDEDSMRESMISSTKELLGNQMEINGEVSVKLFPSPVVTMHDIKVKNKQDFSAEYLATIDSLEARIKFSSLFSLPIVIDKVTLKNANLFLETKFNGAVNYDFPFLKSSNRAISKDDMLGQTLLDLPPQFQNIVFENATITYKNQKAGTTQTISNINGQLTSSSITGPFDYNGTIMVNKMTMNTKFHLDKISANPQTLFSLSLLTESSQSSLNITDGQINRLGDVTQTITGPFSFSIPKLGSFLNEQFGYKNLPADLNRSIIGNGQFTFSNKESSLTEIATRFGEDNIENALSANVSTIYPVTPNEQAKTQVVLRFVKLNLDTFKSYLPHLSDTKETLSKLRMTIPNAIDFLATADQIVLFDQPITNATVSFEGSHNVFTVRDIKATLPDNTSLEASGEVSIEEKKPYANLHTQIQTNAPVSTVTWLNLNLPHNFSLNAVQSLSASSDIKLSANDLNFENININVNQGQITGSLALDLHADNLKGFAALNVKNLNLDTYYTRNTPHQTRSFKQFLTDVKNYLSSTALLGNADLRLKVLASDVTIKDIPVASFSYEGALTPNTLTVHELKIEQAAMSNVTAKGAIQKAPDGTINFQNFAFKLNIPKSLLLFDRLKVASPIQKGAVDLEVQAVLNGSFEQMNVNTEILLGQGLFKAEGELKNILLQAPQYALMVRLNYPNFHQFMRLFNPEFNSLKNLGGSLSFQGKIEGAPQNINLTNVLFGVGTQRFQTEHLNLFDDGTKLKITGDIASPILYTNKFFAPNKPLRTTQGRRTSFSKELIDFSLLDNLVLDLSFKADKISYDKIDLTDAVAKIMLDEKLLTIDEATAKIDSGNLAASLVVNCTTATPFLKGTLETRRVPIVPDAFTLGLFRLKSGLADTSLQWNTRGNSLDDMMRALSATGSYRLDNGAISSLNLQAFEQRVQTAIANDESFDGLTAQLKKEMSIGETPYTSITGTYAITDGVLRTSDTIIKTPMASAIIQSSLDLPRWDISSSVALTMNSFAGYPPISLLIKGNASSPDTSIDLATFIKYVKSTSMENRSAMVQARKERELAQQQKQAQGRVAQIRSYLATAQAQVEQTQKVLQISSSESAGREFIRVQDNLAYLDDLARKSAPSEADVEKAKIQAETIAMRTKQINDSMTAQAVAAVKSQFAPLMSSAEQKMHAINRIAQRLRGVESVDQAYQKGFAIMTELQQIDAYVAQTNDLSQLNVALTRAKENVDILELTYESIAKFDVSTPVDAVSSTPSTVQGIIRRN